MYSVFAISDKCPDERTCTLFEDGADAVWFLNEQWERCVNRLIGNISDMYHQEDYAQVVDFRGYTYEWYLTEAVFNGGRSK